MHIFYQHLNVGKFIKKGNILNKNSWEILICVKD